MMMKEAITAADCRRNMRTSAEADILQDKREKELTARFKEGDKESFDEMVLMYSARLYRVAYGLLGNHQDAEEVVQDTFVRAYKALPEFRGDASLKTWLHRITVNLARNKFHWNRRRGDGVNVSLSDNPQSSAPADGTETLNTDLPDMHLGPDRQLEKEELERNVIAGIRCLPEKLREAMVLRHLEDMSYESIAELLECKVGTVKSRLARGREMLRQILNALDEGKQPPVYYMEQDVESRENEK